MVRHFARRLALGAAAVALASGAGAPASAGGYYYGHHGYHHGHHGHHGHYNYGRHHHGGGKAAAIALGVIGGAIIINELAEEKARRRVDDERYVRNYDRYYTDGARYPQRYEPAPADDVGLEDGNLSDGELDGRLDGGPEPIRISIDSAYAACTRHARNALGARGFVLAAPARPETAEDLGDAWKMTATILAEDRKGASWSRAMYCEADEDRVYLLELI